MVEQLVVTHSDEEASRWFIVVGIGALLQLLLLERGKVGGCFRVRLSCVHTYNNWVVSRSIERVEKRIIKVDWVSITLYIDLTNGFHRHQPEK